MSPLRRAALAALAVAALAAAGAPVAAAAPAAAAAAAASTATWSEDLSHLPSDGFNVAWTGHALEVADGGVHAAAARDTRGYGTATGPQHRLTTPANQVTVTLAAHRPAGSEASVDVRGLGGDGKWTQWTPAVSSGATRLAESVVAVQARITLRDDVKGASPSVASLALAASVGVAPRQVVRAAAAPLTYQVYATREGLVGGRTANGHIIQPDDHFVALPSERGLSPQGSGDYSVQVCGPSACVTAPVWDVGPWNEHDDYWDPSSDRAEFNDLPQGEPEAQAAYQDGYNGGLDDLGTRIQNPAGIDLADGTFADIGMSDNGWVTVSYLWTSGGPPPPAATDDFGDGRQNPAVGRQGDGSMIAFAVSPDQKGLYYRTQSAPNGTWGGWQQLGGAVGGLPVVGRDPDGRLELFVLGPGKNSVMHIWQTAPEGGWSSWDTSFGGPAAGVSVGQNADGRMEVFATAPDLSSISHIWQTAPNGGWSAWNGDGNGQFGGAAGGTPVVGHEADGRMAVFVLGPNGGSIAIREQTGPSGAWGDWNGSFGGPAAGVTVGRNADGRMEVFATAPDLSSISHIWQTAPNGGWSAWNGDGNGQFGGAAGGTPVVGHEADGRMAVFVLGPNGGSIAIREQVAPNSGWGGWNGSFGAAAATVNVSQNADGRMEVFALAPGGSNISHIWQTDPNGGWSAWNGDGTFGGAAWVGP
ncbi:hypothetical protein [Catenulispora subtropica]|uniref:PLL-like beta propeller domain-containing protein n=1 Tax=Catenulispora subtropica TaxID=450798 RepID=A0ABN2SCP9_9ACTN